MHVSKQKCLMAEPIKQILMYEVEMCSISGEEGKRGGAGGEQAAVNEYRMNKLAFIVNQAVRGQL